MKLKLMIEKEVEAKFLKVSANVRYWEDALINGQPSEDGSLVPFANGDVWNPVIDIDKGIVFDWPQGTTASIHFKVCDAGSYYLLDSEMKVIASIENDYVPDGLCHGDSGHGDYIIFAVKEDGSIVDYSNKIEPSNWFDQ